MSGIGHFAVGRPPVVVRPTPDAMSHQLYGFLTCAIDECLRYATRLAGSGHSYKLPSSRPTIGRVASAIKRLRCCLAVLVI